MMATQTRRVKEVLARVGLGLEKLDGRVDERANMSEGGYIL